jgi:hypothetical protein
MHATDKNFEESGDTAGDYNAQLNYWGHFRGAKGQGKLLGRGVPVSLKLDVSNYLSCWDSHSSTKTYCTDGTDMSTATAQPSRC